MSMQNNLWCRSTRRHLIFLVAKESRMWWAILLGVATVVASPLDDTVVLATNPPPSPTPTSEDEVYWWVVAVICVSTVLLWMLLMVCLQCMHRLRASRQRTPRIGERSTVTVHRTQNVPRQAPRIKTGPPLPTSSRMAGVTRKEYLARP